MNIFQRIHSYLRYLLAADNRHGIHSPFVYHYYNKVLLASKRNKEFDKIEQLAVRLEKDVRKITFNELGASSRSQSYLARVSSIARKATHTTKFAKLLGQLSKHHNPEHILEIGTSLGMSTCYLSKGCPGASITTLEGNQSVLEIAKENFISVGLKNIRCVHGNFDQTLAATVAGQHKLDLVFFDGNHRQEPTLKYFEVCLEKAHHDSLFIFDDIHWSSEMEQAWEQIKRHPRVTVTIDLYQFGLVFFKQDQARQHFVLRF